MKVVADGLITEFLYAFFHLKIFVDCHFEPAFHLFVLHLCVVADQGLVVDVCDILLLLHVGCSGKLFIHSALDILHALHDESLDFLTPIHGVEPRLFDLCLYLFLCRLVYFVQNSKLGLISLLHGPLLEVLDSPSLLGIISVVDPAVVVLYFHHCVQIKYNFIFLF